MEKLTKEEIQRRMGEILRDQLARPTLRPRREQMDQVPGAVAEVLKELKRNKQKRVAAV